MLTREELAELVRRMRKKQETFWKMARPEDLQLVRELERKVDGALTEILDYTSLPLKD